jgi:uncharacterized glyoxalase superfamily protein PhnB
MSVKAIPAGHRTVEPYLAIQNAAQALEFYKQAFGATESYRLMMPDGRLGHAEIRLGDCVIMLADEFPEFGGQAPPTLGGSPVVGGYAQGRRPTGGDAEARAGEVRWEKVSHLGDSSRPNPDV